jgi:hypothetical protein
MRYRKVAKIPTKTHFKGGWRGEKQLIKNLQNDFFCLNLQ